MADPKKSNSVNDNPTSTDVVDVDESVAKAIGIQEDFDLSYGEYITLLKEAAIKGRGVNPTIDGPTTEKVTEELKRVRGKKGRIRPKVKKISVRKVFNRKPRNTGEMISGGSSSLALRSANPALSPESLKEEKKEEEEKKEMRMDKFVSSSLQKIAKNINDVEEVVVTILGAEKTKAKSDRTSRLLARRKEKEESSEKKVKEDSRGFLKDFKPEIPFMEQIQRYFGNILAGGAVLGLLNWVKDPENEGKIESFTTFLEETAPVILGAFAALVGLGIGGKLLGFVNLFLPLVKGLMGVLSKLGKALLGAGKALLGVPGVAPLGAFLAGTAGTLLAMKGAVDIAENVAAGGEGQKKAIKSLEQEIRDQDIRKVGDKYYKMEGTERQIKAGKGDRRELNEEEQSFVDERVEKIEKIQANVEERNRAKAEISEQERLEIEALYSDESMTTEYTGGKRASGGRDRVLNEEGKKRMAEIQERAQTARDKENLLSRMYAVQYEKPEEYEALVAEHGEEKAQYLLWSMLTHGDNVTDEKLNDESNIAEFQKDTGIDLSVTPVKQSKKEKDPLTSMDPTMMGAKNPAVFEATKKTRTDMQSRGLTPEQTERKVLEATVSQPKMPEMVGPTGVDAPTLPIAPVQKMKPILDPPGMEDKDKSTILPGQSGGSNEPSASSSSQGDIDFFSSEDDGNDSLLGVKGLYNITAVAT